MNRRRFLSLLAVGAPSAVVAEKLGLYERVRSYFFAPAGGWQKTEGLWLAADWGFTSAACVALQLEIVHAQIPTLFESHVRLLDMFGDEMTGVVGAYDPLLRTRRSSFAEIKPNDLVLVKS